MNCALGAQHISSKELKSINVEELSRLMNQKNKFSGVLVDVRTPYETKSGLLAGAVIKNAYDKDFELFIRGLDRSKRYYVYCHSGVRSLAAVSLMNKYNIIGVNVEGGISAWRKSGHPTINQKRDILKEIIK